MLSESRMIASFRLGSRIAARNAAGRRRGRRASGGKGWQDQRFGLATQDADLYVVPGQIGSFLGLVGRHLVQPAFGLRTMPEAVMGHGQEGKSPGIAVIAAVLMTIVQSTDGSREPPGAVERCSKGPEPIGPLLPWFGMFF